MFGYDIRFEQRLTYSKWLGSALLAFAVAFALFLGAIVLLVTGRDPVGGYIDMFNSAFVKPGALTATILTATPLIFTGLTAALAFRVRIWNIGGDGQLMIGALFASGIALLCGNITGWVSIPLMIFAGALGGITWAWIPAFFRAKTNTNEVLTTLMFNYLAPLLLGYLIFSSRSFWRDTESASAQFFPQGKFISFEAMWPAWGNDVVIPFGFVLAVALAIALQIVLKFTKYGFELLITADSRPAGEYTGINTRRLLITVFLISAAFAGLAGASQVGDFSHRLEPRALQGAAYGYMGIAVAALARYNPLGVIVSALFLGGLVNANLSLQGPELPLGLLGVIQGLILVLVAVCEIFANYRVSIRRRTGRARPVQ